MKPLVYYTAFKEGYSPDTAVFDARLQEIDVGAWGGRTYPVAHDWIINHWDELLDGDVVDVEFILGETDVRKQSERTYGL